MVGSDSGLTDSNAIFLAKQELRCCCNLVVFFAHSELQYLHLYHFFPWGTAISSNSDQKENLFFGIFV